MTRGRKRTPTALHVLHGTFRKDRHAHHEPQPEKGIPDCPEHLDAVAKAEWARVSVGLHVIGVLCLIDRAILAAYCQAYSRWVHAEQQIAATGAVIRTTSGEAKVSPWVRIADESSKLMRAFAVELGLTPSSRARLSIQPPHQQDDFEKFLRGEYGVAKRNRHA